MNAIGNSHVTSVLLLALLAPGCSDVDYKAKIERVMYEDSRTSIGAKSSAEVISRMRAVDTSLCPNDFREAYLAHIHAWELGPIVEQEKRAFNDAYNTPAAGLEAVIRGGFGDPFGKWNESKQAEAELRQHTQEFQLELKRTFDRVEEVAARYGVSPQKR